MFDNLVGYRFWQVAPLGVPFNHVGKAPLHLSLNLEGFPLDILHLFFDHLDTLLQQARIQNAVILEHSGSRPSERPSQGLPCSQGCGLASHDTLELVNFLLEVCAARFRVLVEDLHVVELLSDRHHHLQHHFPIVIKNVLLHARG